MPTTFARLCVPVAAALLVAACVGTDELPRGPEPTSCTPKHTHEPPATIYLTGDDARVVEVGEPDDVSTKVATLDGGVVERCTSRDGRYESIISHDYSADPEIDQPWDVWIVDLQDRSARRVMRIDGDAQPAEDDLSSWHVAYVPGFSASSGMLVVADVRQTEFNDGTDEPAFRRRARWWVVDVATGTRHEVSREGYFLDALQSRTA